MSYPPNSYDPNQAPGQQPVGQPPQPGYGVPPQPGGGYSVPPQQPGFPPQPGGPYGAPPPPMPPASGGGGGLVVKILSGAGVLVIGLAIVIVRSLSSSGDSSDTATEAATETATDTVLSDDELEAAEAAAVGDCMSDAAASATADLVVPCDDATAFWTITKVSDDSGAEVGILGELTDPSIAASVCGEEHAGWTPGELWKSYQYVYTESIAGTGGPVDFLYCTEAIDKEDADGGRPITPETGACTDDGLRTFDCSNPAALYVVDDIETYDPPIDQLDFDQTTALGGCSGSDYYATPVLGGDDLFPVVILAYCSSDNA